MKVFFHIGPHKTGTTSVQHYFLERFGSRNPKQEIWYPEPDSMGPGHAQLATRLREGVDSGSPNPLARLVERARNAGVDKLVLSSEEFSLARQDELRLYAEAVSEDQVTLLTTQKSIISRVPSLWQEFVKHRFSDSLPDATETVLRLPGFRPNAIANFARALEPAEIGIIYSSADDKPEVLIERLCLALDIERDTSTSIRRHNESLGLVEAEVLRSFNKVLRNVSANISDANYTRLRDILYQQLVSPQWRSLCPQIRIECSEEVVARTHSIATEISKAFDALSDEWLVKEYGDRSVLWQR